MTQQITVHFEPWELELLRKWKKGGTDTERGGTPIKASWIKGHLTSIVEDYGYRMWRAYQEFCERANDGGIIIHAGNWQAFRTYLFILREKLGLIERISEKKNGFNRLYMRLVEAKRDHPAWMRPVQSAYPSSDWRLKSKAEKRKLRRKPKSEHKKSGRPASPMWDKLAGKGME